MFFQLVAKAQSERYRNDYVYYAKTDAFYKLHIEMEKVADSKIACRAENSQLMIPESEYDLIQAHAMFKAYPDLGEYMWFGKDRTVHATAEEHLVIDSKIFSSLRSISVVESSRDEQDSNELCEVFTRGGQLLMYPCYHRLPFMCRVSAADAPRQELCDVYGIGYEYNATVDRCYKVSGGALTWGEAAAECAAENADLAVLRSAGQRDAVLAMVRRAPRFSPDARTSWFFLLGFRAVRNEGGRADRIFLTIFSTFAFLDAGRNGIFCMRVRFLTADRKGLSAYSMPTREAGNAMVTLLGLSVHRRPGHLLCDETLEQAGFADWSDNEPNNYGSEEDCGSLFRNDGRLNDVACSHKYRYVCEKRPPRSAQGRALTAPSRTFGSEKCVVCNCVSKLEESKVKGAPTSVTILA
ncbi:Mannose-binding protein C [Eumeta japonica]|uniref:Mannose-binding protein C n=1 Tax=Eumeta variegata TaxID=151549 RepID=A0A4C1YZN9_EUMVA|nr:Mannose-binding protein C [Eumeta japonica]